MIRELAHALLNLALPPRCHICRGSVANSSAIHLCSDCRAGLQELRAPCCTICGKPFTGAGMDHPCGNCVRHPPPWKSARAALLFDGDCRALIHDFKFNYRTHLRRPLGLLTAELLAPFAEAIRADCMIPVPLHIKRLRERGFNQAVLLAEPLAEAWRIPLLRQGLQRIRYTAPQTGLTAAERSVNLKQAFRAPDPQAVNGKRIVLVDDVFTTGSTLSECSRSLMSAGAVGVYAVTVARAPEPDR